MVVSFFLQRSMSSSGEYRGHRARQRRLRRDAAWMISCQAKRVNSGVRPTVLDGEAETGKRRVGGVEAISVLIAVPVSKRSGDRIAMRDSTVHVVDVVNAANPERCLLELGTDELEETGNMCREHGERSSTRWGRIDRSNIGRFPIDVCIELNTFG
jgi:hypothetical protein